MLRILVADDHTIFREGVRRILESHPEVAFVGEAKDGDEMLEQARGGEYDVVLVDISIRGRGDGLEALKQLKNEMPNLATLALSMYPEEQYAARALRAGASGYLTKESASDELFTAIRQVSKGRKYVSTSIAEKLASALFGDSEKKLHEHLSDREFSVLRMIGKGMTLRKIAQELCLSEKTVSTYRSRLLEKMGMGTNADLIRYALSEGLAQ